MGKMSFKWDGKNKDEPDDELDPITMVLMRCIVITVVFMIFLNKIKKRIKSSFCSLLRKESENNDTDKERKNENV